MLNCMTLNSIHSILEGYDRKRVKCKQIRQVREEKHYTHKELLNIYLKLAAKYNKRGQEQREFNSFNSYVEEYKDKLDQL